MDAAGVSLVIIGGRHDSAEVAPAARHNNDKPTRLAISRPAASTLRKTGSLSNDEFERLRMAADRSRRTAHRMVEEALLAPEIDDNEPDPDPIVHLPHDFLLTLAKHQGNVNSAIDAFFGADPPFHRATIYRWLDDVDPGLKLALKKGLKAFEQFLAIGVYEPELRNELVILDELHIPFLACRRGREVVDDMWLLVVMEAFSRLVLAAFLGLGQVTGSLAGSVYARSVLGWDSEDIHVGGRADTTLVDRAFSFKSRPFVGAVSRAGSKLVYARPYTPRDKAKLERFNWTLVQKYLLGLGLGYVDGPTRPIYLTRPGRSGKLEQVRLEVPFFVPSHSNGLLQVEAFGAAVKESIHQYNHDHVISTTGQTPLARYASQSRLQLTPGPAAFYSFAQPLDRLHTKEKRGLWVDGAWRKAAELELRKGDFEVRVLPGMPEDIFMAGEQVGTQSRFVSVIASTEKPDEAKRRLARNVRRKAFIKDLALEAHRAALAEIGEETTPVPVGTKGSRLRGRRNADSSGIANRTALRAVRQKPAAAA